MSKLCVRELYVRKLRVCLRDLCVSIGERRRRKATDGRRTGAHNKKTRTPHKTAGKNAKNSTNHYLKITESSLNPGTFSGPFFGSSVIGLAQLILQLPLVFAVVPLLPGGFVTQWEHHCLKALAESARR